MPENHRQNLLNKLFNEGIGLTGQEMERRVKHHNNFEMRIKDRHKWGIENFEICRFWFER